MTDTSIAVIGERCVRRAVQYQQPGELGGYCITSEHGAVDVFIDLRGEEPDLRVYGKNLTPEMTRALSAELHRKIQEKTAWWYERRQQ